MEPTAMEKFEASERIDDYFDAQYGYDWQTIYEQSDLCYGKLDPTNIDEIPEAISKLRERTFSNVKLQSFVEKVEKNDDESYLLRALGKLRLKCLEGDFKARLVSYILHIRLTELGLAPRWRQIKKPVKASHEEWSENQKRYMCDLQVFDMQWVHATYPKHSPKPNFNYVFRKLYDAEEFDFARAQVIAHGELTLKKKMEYLKLNDDKQAELIMLRSPNIDRQLRAVERDTEKVEIDLELAANRNRHRGKKLLEAMPDKLKVWQSTKLVPTKSIAAMHDNYEKLSGNKITRSSYMSKLKSLNSALKEVDSSYTLDFLKNEDDD